MQDLNHIFLQKSLCGALSLICISDASPQTLPGVRGNRGNLLLMRIKSLGKATFILHPERLIEFALQGLCPSVPHPSTSYQGLASVSLDGRSNCWLPDQVVIMQRLFLHVHTLLLRIYTGYLRYQHIIFL